MPLSHIDDLQRGLSWGALQHALSVINEGIAVADPTLPDAPMVYVNDAFTRLTGYSREECIGRNCRFLQGPATDAAALGRLRVALAEHRDCQVELLNYRKDGTPFWNLLSITHVWQPEGEEEEEGVGTAAAAAARFGIPPQAGAAEMQQQEQQQAEASSGKRLRYLIGVQSDISDLARKAQTAQAARNRFIANMSHELRTPLNGILATTQLLLTSQLSPEQRELADTILDSSLSLLGTLGDILDFSLLEAAPESDGLALRHEPVCLQQAFEGVAEMVALSAAAKTDLELAFLIDPAVLAKGPHIWGDATRLRQVLHHLVSNAVKYSDRGEVVVRASLHPATAAAGGSSREALAISVKDTGIGMSPDLQDGLFQSFRTGSDALNRRYGGTGLGLALSKRLAEAMGGNITVESELGKGSTFTLVLHPDWCTDDGSAVGVGSAQEGTASQEGTAVAARREAGGDGAQYTAPLSLQLTRNANTDDTACGTGHGSTGALSAAESVPGAAPAVPSSSSSSSSESACGSPPAAVAHQRASLGSLHPSSVSSDLDGDGCLCGCAQAHAHACAQFMGRRVLVDVPSELAAEQVCQMLQQLGMIPVRPSEVAAAAAAAEGAVADALPSQAAYADVAVVSACRVTVALRGGWRGRPLVVIGSVEEVPERLHPLVVVVAKPVRLGRLVAALQRAAGLLTWQGGVEHAPRLGRSPALLATSVAGVGGAAGGGGVGAAAASAAFGGAAAGPRGVRLRQRASIDNSALRHSPQLVAPVAPGGRDESGGATVGAGNATAAPARSGLDLLAQHPPPLDLAAPAGSEAAPSAERVGGAGVLRGLRPLTDAVKSVFTSAKATTALQHQQEPPRLQAPPPQQQQQPVKPPNGSSGGGSSSCAPSPPRPPSAQDAVTVSRSLSAAPAPSSPLKLLRVLIAEDNRVNQMVLIKVLQAVLPGVRPDVVANGLQVLEAVAARPYDICFLDIHMPEMDGVTAAERIRDDPSPAHPRPRIVAVTADTLASLRQRCAEAGVEAFIPKPFRVEDLKRVLERLGMATGAAPAATAAAATAAPPPPLPPRAVAPVAVGAAL